MLINEIEVAGTSFSFRRFTINHPGIHEMFVVLADKADKFSIEDELPGFHDIDRSDTAIRGFYSMIIPFEVTHLVDGITTKTLFKRIESCEFVLTEKMALVFGDAGPAKCMLAALSAVTGNHVEVAEYEYQQLYRLQERINKVSAIALSNPKEMSVRKARLTGNIEHYTEYDIVNRGNHGIEYVQGLIENTPLGPMRMKVSKKGVFNLGVRRGMILTIECLEWLVGFVENESVPDLATGIQATF